MSTAVDAVAASPTAQCRKDCGAAKRSCVSGAKELFRTTKADCANAVSKDVRKSCKQAAKTTFQGFKKGCGTSLQQCRGCCATTAQGAATPQGNAGTCNNGGGGGGGGGGGTPVDTSSICQGITGGLAAYWDWLNGVFHPLAQIPTAGGNWLPYQHPDYPLLGFRYPTDWTPETISAPQTIGMNLFRNDRGALWREVAAWSNSAVANVDLARQLRDQELNGWLQAINNTGPVTTLCVNEETAPVAPGVTAAGSNIIVTANGFTLIVKASLSGLDGGGGQIFFNTIVARSDEMGQLAFDVFLPIHFQLFVGSTTQDSDGDGIPDSQDNFPNDPTRG